MLNGVENPPKVPVESLRRGLLLLEQLGEHGTLSLSELANLVGLKRTTTHNLLKTLVLCGYVSSLGEGRYSFGDKLRLLSHSDLLHRIARGQVSGVLSILRALSEQFGEALVLTGLLNGRRAVLVRTRPQQAVRVSFSFFEQPALPLWNTVTGLVLAAHVADDYHPELLRLHGVPDSPWLSLDDPAGLTAALHQIRAQGYIAHLVGEVYAVAVPVLDAEGSLLAALGLHMPAFRRQTGTDAALLSQLQTGAQQLADIMQQESDQPTNDQESPLHNTQWL